MTTPSDTAREIALVRDALRFFVWAAGEGLSPAEDDVPEPETTLFEYAVATGNEDWDNYPDTVTTALTAAYARGIEDTRQWQPIETAPKDGTQVLGWTPAGHDIVWYSEIDQDRPDQPGTNPGWWGFYGETAPGRTPDHGFGGNPSWYWPPQNQPTHWMPLPQPPAEGGGR